MEKSDFKVLVRRVPGYEPTVSVRFEMTEGYGELHVGERRKASPAAAGEAAEVTGEAVRGGRFVHVLASGRRRQSYAFSRLDDDSLQRIPDDTWTDLTPVTEFGIRYLELPAVEATTTVAVQLNPGDGNERAPTPTGAESSLLARARSRARASTDAPAAVSLNPRGGSANPAPVRAAAARTTTANPAAARVQTASPVPRSSSSSVRPAPPRAAAATASPNPARGIAVESGIGKAAIQRLSPAELREHLLAEMAKVEALHQALAEAEQRIERSLAREADLVAVISRWSERG